MSRDIDPELVDDRETQEGSMDDVTLPPYDPEEFEVSDDFEYVEEDDDNGDQDEE